MTDQTAAWDLPYSTTDDTIESIAATMQSLAGRMDYLLGETGEHVFGALVANASKTETHALGRAYPNGAIVVVSFTDVNVLNPGTIELWCSDVAPAGNSFDVSVKATQNLAAGARSVYYIVKPKP
jgi:hypothetical protein